MKLFVRLSVFLIAVIQFSDLSVRTDVLTAETQRPHTLFSIDSDYSETSSVG